jgi:hypothetical protein
MMRRVLAFDDNAESRRRFSLLYEALLIGGFVASQDRPGVERKGFESVRREAKILRKFKAISEDNPDDKLGTGEPNRRLVAPGGEILLEQPEHDLMKKYAETCHWKVSQADDVIDAVDDFLGAAPQRAAE